MSRKKNVYNQAKRGVKRYKKAKARKKGRAAIFAVVAMILAAVGVSQKNIGQLEQAVDNILDAYETTVDAETSQAVGDGGNAEVPAGSAAPDDAISETPDNETPAADGSGQTASGDSSGFATVPSGTEIGAGAEVYVDLAAIPAYSGEPYAIVNGNIPYFTASDLTSESFEYYSDLDNLGRCSTAYASVGTDLMPTEKRGSISKVKPSGWQTVTIDGEDAKDLDDAITISRESYGYRLGVHIADVSHYVTEGSPLDEEALNRGTSVYLVDRVIPMLPHKLSNGICSLNEGTDRLALSCIMEIDPQGRVLGHEIAETVIRVDRRMTYTAVNAIVTDRDEKTMEEYADFVEMFDLMKELADILREKRRQRGSIDFDFPESKIILDEKGRPVDIKPYERNAATKIIEDFMLMANETIAEDYFWQDIPFVYRTHDNPDPEKMKRLGVFINNFGYTIRTHDGEVHPKELQKLLKKIEGTEEEALISRLTLRSMKQAKYMPVCSGHFGLAAKYYTHFTSPIRRYPDLQIHRIIKENLRGGLSEKRIAHYDKILTGVTIQCSATERRAEEAERETIKLKKCEYMSRRIGEIFDGVISGVTNWGFYVELPNTVEGLVHVNELHGDYYVFNEERMELRGEMSGKTYKLGQKIQVMVTGTDRLTKTIDFITAK